MLNSCLYNDRFSNERLHFPGVQGTIHLTRVIGAGGHSEVYATTYKNLVVKVFTFDTASESEELNREVRFHMQSACEQVVRLDGFIYEKKTGFILLERGIPISHYDERNPRMIMALAVALRYLHSHGIAHRDVKVENMLYCGQNFKLADFGSATYYVVTFDYLLDSNFRYHVQNDIYTHTTTQFRAPEQIELLHDNGPIGTAVDVFAFGVLLFKALTNEYPFDSEFAAFQCKPNLSIIQDEQYRNVVARCLVRQVSERATMVDIVCYLSRFLRGC